MPKNERTNQKWEKGGWKDSERAKRHIRRVLRLKLRFSKLNRTITVRQHVQAQFKMRERQHKMKSTLSHLVTWVLVLKSSARIDCSTSTQPMYCPENRKASALASGVRFNVLSFHSPNGTKKRNMIKLSFPHFSFFFYDIEVRIRTKNTNGDRCVIQYS